MSKKIILLIAVIIIAGIGYWAYQQKPGELEQPSEAELACVSAGGEVSVSLCCKSTEDFPNLCLIGACGCSPENSRQVKVCDCGVDKCFNGDKCLFLDEALSLLNEFELETGIDFSDVQPAAFRWAVEAEGEVKEADIDGKGFSSEGIAAEQGAKVEGILADKGFKKDPYNISAGTVSESSGYKKDQIVCVVMKGASGYKEAVGEWIPPEPDKIDIEVMCGSLEIILEAEL